jgi:DNA-binding Lrp family transcriptional regulator
MRADNSRHLAAAARDRAQQTHAKALRALRALEDTGRPVTFEAVAREAGVSRSWLYSEPGIRATIDQLRARRPSPTASVTPKRQRATDDSLLRRLQAATERMRQLEEDNRQLRHALAEALGVAREHRVTGATSPRDTPGKRAARIIGPC